MKKLFAAVLAGSFAFLAVAEDAPKPAPKKAACGMECCTKNKATCKTCPECKKPKAPKTEAPKPEPK